jgi:hypothetical protein
MDAEYPSPWPDMQQTPEQPEPMAELVRLLRETRDLLAAGQAEGLDAAAAAAYLGISVSKLHQLNAAGHVPAPAYLGDGRCPRWSRGELTAFLRVGAPARARWLSMKEVAMRRSG